MRPIGRNFIYDKDTVTRLKAFGFDENTIEFMDLYGFKKFFKDLEYKNVLLKSNLSFLKDTEILNREETFMKFRKDLDTLGEAITEYRYKISVSNILVFDLLSITYIPKFSYFKITPSSVVNVSHKVISALKIAIANILIDTNVIDVLIPFGIKIHNNTIAILITINVSKYDDYNLLALEEFVRNYEDIIFMALRDIKTEQ